MSAALTDDPMNLFSKCTTAADKLVGSTATKSSMLRKPDLIRRDFFFSGDAAAAAEVISARFNGALCLIEALLYLLFWPSMSDVSTAFFC